MNNKLLNAVIGGIAGTLVMTMITLIAPMMGMPKMSAPGMLSMMMGVPLAVGWMMHLMIGVIFALAYVFFLNKILGKVNNNILRGAIFGIIVFVFAQMAMPVMGAVMGGMAPMEGSMMLMMIGSLIGHIFYGATVGAIVKEPEHAASASEINHAH